MMSNLNEEDIALIMESKGENVTIDVDAIVSDELKELCGSDISRDLLEWSKLVTELSNKEIALYKWKECYQIKSEEIIANTDFKALYGKNNEKVRKVHVKNELGDWYTIIKDLEFSIDYLVRRISYLKELIRTKRVLMEIKE